MEGHAFGLALRSALPIDGIEGSLAGLDAPPATAVELAHKDDLTAGWTFGDGVERVDEWHFDDGTLQGSLDRHPALGYRLSVRGYGTYVVSPSGDSIRCAPPPGEERWRWQRCLVGQILPLAAALRGVEVFHSSAVSVGDVAVGIVGASGDGKSSVAVNLVLRGFGFVADDVLALGAADSGALVAYPGPAITSVRRAEAEALGSEGLSRLGPILGDDGEVFRLLVERDPLPRPIGALYFLNRDPSGATDIEEIRPPDFRLLVRSQFNLSLGPDERRVRHLEVCQRLAEDVRQFWIRVGAGTTAAEVADLVAEHVVTVTGVGRR
jgi:hypothetical protein